MTERNYTNRFTVPRPPAEVYDAICHVQAWWSEGIEGQALRVGDRFTHSVLDLHRCELQVVEMVPHTRIVWKVLENHFSFTQDKTEWNDTHIVFEILPHGSGTELRFTHVGLVPEYECHDICRDGWNTYVASLRDLILTGSGRPNVGKAITDSEARLMRQTKQAS